MLVCMNVFFLKGHDSPKGTDPFCPIKMFGLSSKIRTQSGTTLHKSSLGLEKCIYILMRIQIERGRKAYFSNLQHYKPLRGSCFCSDSFNKTVVKLYNTRWQSV